MRYSFHGKVRATGQQVDGYVEAASSSEAIDRLADQGIIGVHTVRPEAKKPRNPVILGSADNYEDEPVKALPAAAAPAPAPAPQPIYIPVPTPMPAPVAAQTASTGTEQVLGQLVEKLATLLGQVEKLLSRPQQIVYQSGPARNGGGGGGTKRSPRQGGEAQDKTLLAIFQTNMDLRRSLDKLSTVVSNGAANGQAGGGSNGSPSGPTNGSLAGSAAGSSAGSANGSALIPSAPAVVVPSRIEPPAKPAPAGRERALKPQPVA